jgi:uncharacterized cupredoxin-like copper-binding protein
MTHPASSHRHSPSETFHPGRLRSLVTRALACVLPIRLSSVIITVSLCLPALVVYTAPAGQTVTVTMNTFGTQLDHDDILAGDVRFVVKNDASDMNHEFVLVRTDLSLDKLPVDEEGTIDEDSPLILRILATEDLKPDTRREFLVTLVPGHYVYFCNIDAHHMIGMRGEFSVEPQMAEQ